MFRPALPDGRSRRSLDRLSNRVTKTSAKPARSRHPENGQGLAAGVKAALNRGLTKLAAPSASSKSRLNVDSELTSVMKLYAARFKRRDWDRVRKLIRADARRAVAGRVCRETDGGSVFRELRTLRDALEARDG